jgi:nucleoside-diphosphate-sugar epimerase
LNYGEPKEIRCLIDKLGVPDTFIHLGWGNMEDPCSTEHLTRNVDHAKSLMDTLYDAGLARFVFIGSVNEYGSRTGLLAEDMPAEGIMTNYAKGKAMVAAYGMEQTCHHDRAFLSIRVFYTYGQGQRSGSLINKLIRSRIEGIRPDLGPCEHYRDYIHVTDVAEGIARLCHVDQATTVNLGSGHAVSVREFVELFWKKLGGAPEDLQFGANPMRAGEPAQPHSFASLERLRHLTDWAPRLSLEEGIDVTIRATHK